MWRILCVELTSDLSSYLSTPQDQASFVIPNYTHLHIHFTVVNWTVFIVAIYGSLLKTARVSVLCPHAK